MAEHQVQVGRIYDEPRSTDGRRVLVDRLWPRGVSKERAGLDEWCKAVAPSAELRTWYAHDPAKFEEFSRRYRAELSQPPAAEAFASLQELVRQGPVILLTAAKRADISEATVLVDLLRG
jgi:uncharacterized protein YeaO (DUF488 family)